MLRQIVDQTNTQLRKLSGAGEDHAAAAEADRELHENLLPALENEDAVIGAAARATARWMKKERERFYGARAAG